MTNKQAYAGLLDDETQMGAAICWLRLLATRFSDEWPQTASAARSHADNLEKILSRPEAAEAISSLLKALTEARVYVAEKADDAYSTREDDLLSVIDAALNSDAPLSIGEGGRD